MGEWFNQWSAKPFTPVRFWVVSPRKANMKRLTIIACVQPDGGIGFQGDLIWKLPIDQAIFKHFTNSHTVVMGRKTYESIGHVLKGRKNIVLSKNTDLGSGGQFDLIHTASVFDSFESLDKYLPQVEDEVFIVGGASLYNYYLPKADRLVITHVKAKNQPADTFFPDIPDSFNNKVLVAKWRLGVSFDVIEYTKLDFQTRWVKPNKTS